MNKVRDNLGEGVDFNLKAKKFLATCLLGVTLAGPIAVSAETMESLDKKENALLQQSQTISADVQAALQDINETYQAVEDLKGQIKENEETLAKTQKEIAATEATIAERKELMTDRLKSLQLNASTEDKLAMLLESSSIQDFINGVYAITVMQTAANDEIETLQAETDKLQKLEKTVSETQSSLETDQATLVSQADALDSKITTLQAELADNQTALAEVANSKAVEEQRMKAEAERKAKAEAEAKEAAEAEKRQAEQEAAKESISETPKSSASSESTVAEETTKESTNNVTNTPAPPKQDPPATNNGGSENKSSGRVMYMESTAYSYSESGASFFTASGLDLRQNPQAIAVDPSVIPLGTLVEVEGYGVAIAADTGGAIKGNIIDVHFKTTDECLQWGRRHNVKVTILE